MGSGGVGVGCTQYEILFDTGGGRGVRIREGVFRRFFVTFFLTFGF